ncbi:PadR family transcriptional regulator [Gryllotalpicola ginsengisoli]|uniref:PadR family transcriptional regulator n=1 Tax=Gryllotalpicola ginsengisoli TaxID=444608 RepID=UPI0003B60546|nr:PadR family transcriptional regulator [Gryllotalpicola ginsengisoli]
MTPLAISALALLSEHPMHPYEMYQTLIQRHEDRIVKVRPGSLYHTINKLAELGLVRVTGTEREGNRPERTTYEITEKGQLALAERIAETIGEPVYEFPSFPVAIGEAHNLPRHTVIDLVRRRLKALDLQRAELDDALAELGRKELPRRYWLDVSYLEAVQGAERAWLQGLLADLESGELDWGDGGSDPAPSAPTSNAQPSRAQPSRAQPSRAQTSHQ